MPGSKLGHGKRGDDSMDARKAMLNMEYRFREGLKVTAHVISMVQIISMLSGLLIQEPFLTHFI